MTTAEVTNSVGARLAWMVRDYVLLARRYMLHARRLPAQLFFTMLQPLLFVVLFAYVFGEAIPLPGGADYTQYVMVGIFLQTIAFAGMTTGAGLADELGRGMVDRFRSLPMAPSAPLVGRAVSDVARNAFTIGLMILIGLAVGWRISSSPLPAIGGFLLLLLCSFVLSWCGMLVGLLVGNTQGAVSAGIGVVFPLVWLSNAFVPLTGMSTGMRAIASWNPVSSFNVAIRELLGNPNPVGADPALPMRYPIAASLLWILAVLIVSSWGAMRAYRRRTS
ncbi:ABC-2 type transport system permease protein [Tamaricihabitans halophyticus]|uniref:Transport permease protein n=1 Tax=Tamaricihabitans halophyticus TaxID=1262583 RepID=A0A4R2R4W7_9PSEU|nr:ABC transporter permease [Tamaricihabitans halophyticus]TCP56768.1 ABC-2 type transport system permease protein [Tamaricihabitans halophyticus]